MSRSRPHPTLARLPHTRDGRPIVPGMRLWWVFRGHRNQCGWLTASRQVISIDMHKTVNFLDMWRGTHDDGKNLFALKRNAEREARRRSKR